jgi:hypothetical protein
VQEFFGFEKDPSGESAGNRCGTLINPAAAGVAINSGGGDKEHPLRRNAVALQRVKDVREAPHVRVPVGLLCW